MEKYIMMKHKRKNNLKIDFKTEEEHQLSLANDKIKHYIYHHFMENEGEKVEVMTDFLFLGSKITADSDGSHKIRRHCFLAGKPRQTWTVCCKAETSLWRQRSI